MSIFLKAGGDAEPEQPLREGWLVKQSGGSGGRGRRRSVGEIMKKWDERYFVLTTMRLYYFKTMEVCTETAAAHGVFQCLPRRMNKVHLCE